MNIFPSVSIVICTRNRAEQLRQTLDAISRLFVPEGCSCDLTVVDNGSTDNTAEVIQSFPLSNMPLQYVLEATPGLAHAYNAGVAATTGDILLYTDDDVRPPADWLAGMCRPFMESSADAVAGGIKLAPYLYRPWLKPEHIGWLASTECLQEGETIPLIGANMAFARRVLKQVPRFDGEVKQGMDSLFCYQIEKAGYRVAFALGTTAEHHVEEARLTRKAFAALAKNRGEHNSHLMRHWSHSDPRFPLLSLVRSFAGLWAMRVLHLREWVTYPTVPAWELKRLEALHTRLSYLRKRNEPRKYEKFGLVKLEQPLS